MNNDENILETLLFMGSPNQKKKVSEGYSTGMVRKIERNIEENHNSMKNKESTDL